MNTEYRYQLESKKLTGHQPRKLDCPHCGKRKCFVRYVDTKNGNQYVADSGCYQKWSHVMQQTTGILYNVSRGLEQYPPNTDLCDLLL